MEKEKETIKNWEKEEEAMRDYADEVKIKLDGFEIQHLMDLLETEIIESESISGIKVTLSLYEKLEDIFDKNWRR